VTALVAVAAAWLTVLVAAATVPEATWLTVLVVPPAVGWLA
jgi:hypothetical protein